MTRTLRFRPAGAGLMIGALAVLATIVSIAPLAAQTALVGDGPLSEVERLVGSLGVTSADIGTYPDVGTADGSRPTGGSASLTLPDGATPVRVVAYWAGRGEAWTDSDIVVNEIEVVADREYSWSWPGETQHVYAADVTERVDIPPGKSTVTIAGLDSPTEQLPYGASLVVVYEDPNLPEVELVIREGNDFAFSGSAYSDEFGNVGFHSAVTCTEFGPALEDRIVELRTRIAGVDSGQTGGPGRTQQLQWFSSDGPIVAPERSISRFTALQPAAGASGIVDNPVPARQAAPWGFEVAATSAVLAAEQTHVCTQALTTSLGDGEGASFALTDATVSAESLYRVGDTAFLDMNDNGLADSGDMPIGAVTLELWPDGSAGPIEETVVSNEGHYRFERLAPGRYRIVIPAGQTAQIDGEIVPLDGYFAVAANDDESADNNSNITPFAGGWETAVFELGDDGSDGEFTSSASAEPTNEVDPFTGDDADPDDVAPLEGNYDDVRSNYSIDIGFTETSPDGADEPVDDGGAAVGGIGDLIWIDADNNGRADAGERGVADVLIEVYRDENGDGAPDDDQLIATATTDELGAYQVSDLDEGSYVLLLPLSNWDADGALFGCVSSDPTTVDPGDDVDGDDNGMPLLDVGVLAGPVVVDEANPKQTSIDFGCYRPQFDLALEIDVVMRADIAIGDLVVLKIDVSNEGSIAASDIAIDAYLPADLVLADYNWTSRGDSITTNLEGVTLRAGEMTSVLLQVEVRGGVEVEVAAEISAARATVIMPNGEPIPDLDSTPDAVNDDGGIEGEDDHDATVILVEDADDGDTPADEPPIEPDPPGVDVPIPTPVPFPVLVPYPVFVPYPFPVFIPVGSPTPIDVCDAIAAILELPLPGCNAGVHDVAPPTDRPADDSAAERADVPVDDPEVAEDGAADGSGAADVVVGPGNSPVDVVTEQVVGIVQLLPADESPATAVLPDSDVELVPPEEGETIGVRVRAVGLPIPVEGSVAPEVAGIVVERTAVPNVSAVAVAQVDTQRQVDVELQLALTGKEASLGTLLSLMMLVAGVIFWLLGNRRRLVNGSKFESRSG